MRIAIDSIAAGGDGVGRRADGLTVFVPRSAPGDVVDVEILTEKDRWARGWIQQVVTAGPNRVEPVCMHYVRDHCGGCQLQHLSLEAQRSAKRRIVGDALRRIGKVEMDDPPIRPAATSWGYRRKITFSVPVSDSVGYRRVAAPDSGFEVEDCPIADPRLITLWRGVRDALRGMPNLRAVVLRVGDDDDLHLLVRGASARDVRTAAAAVGGPDQSVIWWAQPPGRGARAVAGAGVEAATPASPMVFEQSDPALAQQIRTDVVAALAPGPGQVVWDLYGGTGATARALEATGATVWSVDRDREAVAHARRSGVSGAITYIAEPVEKALRRLPRPDRIVVNPPRAGLSPRVADAVREVAPERAGVGVVVGYVSCDPATLARDLGRLSPLSVRDVRTYDQFPHTSHVETLALLGAPDPGGGS